MRRRVFGRGADSVGPAAVRCGANLQFARAMNLPGARVEIHISGGQGDILAILFCRQIAGFQNENTVDGNKIQIYDASACGDGMRWLPISQSGQPFGRVPFIQVRVGNKPDAKPTEDRT